LLMDYQIKSGGKNDLSAVSDTTVILEYGFSGYI